MMKSAKKWRPWAPLGFVISCLQPKLDQAAMAPVQVSLIRLISVCLSGQESSHHILNFFAKRNILLTKNF